MFLLLILLLTLVFFLVSHALFFRAQGEWGGEEGEGPRELVA